MTATKKKTSRPPAPRYRTVCGVVAAWIEDISETPGRRMFQARTMPAGRGAGISATALTPRLAVALLEATLGEPTTPANEPSAALLRAPFKLPGQNPGGPPLKRAEKATGRFTVRIPPALKERLQGRAQARGISPGQYLLDALEAELLRDQEDRARTRRSKPPTASTQ